MLLVQMVYCVLGIYGVTQQPETKEYMIVMQYAKNGSLPTYLDQNINKLTWKRKLQYLDDIALHLSIIHKGQLVHCDLHGENIVLTDDKFDNDIQPVICNFGLSKSASSSPTTSSIQGVLPYIAPEVLYSRKFTQSQIFILLALLCIRLLTVNHLLEIGHLMISV